jgi:hypothetical protein
MLMIQQVLLSALSPKETTCLRLAKPGIILRERGAEIATSFHINLRKTADLLALGVLAIVVEAVPIYPLPVSRVQWQQEFYTSALFLVVPR